MNKNIVMSRKFVLAVAVLALAATIVALVPVAASAQGRGWFGGFGKAETDRDQLLADALGITVDQLQAARQKAAETGIQKQLDDGWIGQKQADVMLARTKLQPYLDQDKLMAAALGITVAELQKARDTGQTVNDLMKAKGLDAATMQSNLQTAREKAVEQAVKDGVITSDQATLLKDQVGGPGGCSGHRGGRGMMGGFGDSGGRGMMDDDGPGGRLGGWGTMRMQRSVPLPSEGA
jgi:hypothetical protein